MAQTTQIVPEFNYPHVMTVINDYTKVRNIAVEPAADTSIKEIYAVTASKGIDNTWVKLSSHAAAVKMFGDSNFKKFGQPLMQALEVLNRDNAQVWMMRVMPEAATYANTVISLGYKADALTSDAHKAKFRIKITGTSVNKASTNEVIADALKAKSAADAEGFQVVPVMSARYVGRGKCGNYYSLRMTKATAYESEYGITMYNFNCMNSESVVETDATYVAGIVTTAKYDTATLIDDVISDAATGSAPIVVATNEDNIEAVYDAYVEFIKSAHAKLVVEYTEKLATAGLTEKVLSGEIAPTTETEKANLAELKEIEALIAATTTVPDIDEFDPIFGQKMGSTSSLPMIAFVKTSSDSIDTSDPSYDAADYTADTVVNFTSVKGCLLFNGEDGQFETPDKEEVAGVKVTRTVEQEVEKCLVNAYNGTYDRKILSSRRMPISAYFDANYPFAVKKAIVDVATLRGDRHVWLDCGIVPTISAATAKSISTKYAIFDTSDVSVDVSGYKYRETTTNKKCDVTIEMLLAPAYVTHVTEVGFHIPFVKDRCVLEGHIKDSLFPLITEADKAVQGILYDNRINYFECIGENQYQRCVQNTTQKDETDLLEENNDNIIKTLKFEIEDDVRSQIYNFADESVRQNFIALEKIKYAAWNNNIVQSFDIKFATSEYEFEKSILHCYVEVVLRGLTKTVIVEIDINKREYASSNTTEEN